MTLERRSPMPRQPRPKQCGNPDCRQQFTPRQMGQKCCCGRCERIHGAMERARRQERERADRKRRTKAELEAMKTPQQKRSDALKRCQKAFNRYIRARDRLQGRACISCGDPMVAQKQGGIADCSHYRSIGAAPHLRFNVNNAALGCVKCNRWLSGNAVEFRIALVKRIGAEKVEQLENDNAVRRFDVEYLERLKTVFNRRAALRERMYNQRRAG